ncbi:pyridoxal kinase PdxY [Pseudovibrio sp. Tun.PSC04-5.I4]|uniref:pyridoxal kinase PdxY n=1 Tax=Pseudovibrio sp. Tun.PSC04-5.I4 TaxID=1798213 RepID=UPI00087F7CCE|nr:pyridoxal kinase PdxY [Pseudovibrio sp. Tun.PSC04-5.I4]SDQ21755.1 Pyridoxal kinase [Pseudovibrio sp. Tun.PSC04-5.I4]
MRGILSIQSHVTYGHAGNGCAVFPMQRMGHEVWAINTVQFSNHTQHPQGWTGQAHDAKQIAEMFEGLSKLNVLSQIKGIVTGYLGGASHCDVIADIVSEVRRHNPDCLYFCDPVMGAPDKGCIVSEGVAELLVSKLLPMADVIVPNQFELSQFIGEPISSLEEAERACTIAREKGPKMVLAKHLHSVSDEAFTMMLATPDGNYLAQRPHLSFDRQPVGVGDLITSVFAAGYLNGATAVEAFEHCNNAVYGILKATHDKAEWELQTIAAQNEFISPSDVFKLKTL